MSYTAEDLRRIQAEHRISIHEAKLRLDKLAMMQQVTQAKTLEDIKPILLKLIDEL